MRKLRVFNHERFLLLAGKLFGGMSVWAISSIDRGGLSCSATFLVAINLSSSFPSQLTSESWWWEISRAELALCSKLIGILRTISSCRVANLNFKLVGLFWLWWGLLIKWDKCFCVVLRVCWCILETGRLTYLLWVPLGCQCMRMVNNHSDGGGCCLKWAEKPLQEIILRTLTQKSASKHLYHFL